MSNNEIENKNAPDAPDVSVPDHNAAPEGHPSRIGSWIEAMRLRTLPVSVSGVVLGCGLALGNGQFRPVPALFCLIFALLAQIASNFANEYYDYRDGLDRPGREGPRRGVTEGDITPQAMYRATFLTLGVACAVGCALVLYGGWWLIGVGVALALLAVGYSAGPYPLSRHALGELTVVLCFGVVPVCLTYYVQALTITPFVFTASVSAGLMGANVLIVNNYRDMEEDRAVGKTTLAQLLGPRLTRGLYAVNGVTAMALMIPLWQRLPVWALVVPAAYLLLHFACCGRLATGRGRALNPLLGATSRLMLMVCVAVAVLLTTVG